jgi:hypothetical protein
MAVATAVLTVRELGIMGIVGLAKLGREFDLNSDEVWEKLQSLTEVKKVLSNKRFQRDDVRIWNQLLEIEKVQILVRELFLSTAARANVRISKPIRKQ